MRHPPTRAWWSRLAALATSPVTRTDLLQLVKAVAAAVLSWVLARTVLGLEQAFLAPWVALLTVHATVHRTIRRGAQTILAVGLGVVLAALVVQALGATTWSLGVALLVGLGLARLRVVREEGVAVATTALFVITTGDIGSTQQALDVLPDRLLATAIGVLVAFAVNLLVLPPLNDSSARRQVDEVDRALGGLLLDMAEQLRGPARSEQEEDWIERTRAIDADIDHAWSLVRFSGESRTWNPRRRRYPNSPEDVGLPDVLTRLEDGVSQARSIARHVRESDRAAQEWDPRFRDRYLELLAGVGRCVADPRAAVDDLRSELRALVEDLSTEDLSGLYWPLYGSLLASLGIIVEVVDDVATARPVRT